MLPPRPHAPNVSGELPISFNVDTGRGARFGSTSQDPALVIKEILSDSHARRQVESKQTEGHQRRQ
jgi:hypothetical protein